ncbi:relaxin receptor 1 [Orussus abietinus]|uniref:relaxin receptor 1 n=1 Tax=Orussus abietinus TaxID=222816 RepID=UPI000C715F76|nr:relaxin receptor 1 [Orussus abietinus]
MRHKHITIVGVSLITVVVILSILMYYFNQDECPVGTFLCRNSTVCIPQRNWCNGFKDCPEGDDETLLNCSDLYGSWTFFYKERNWKTAECDSSNCPRGCNCGDCTVTCTGFTKIPPNLSGGVTRITLVNSSLAQVGAQELKAYTELQFLFLQNNGIVSLDYGTFSSQTHLYWLVLSNNKIESILRGQLIGLKSLELLKADNNSIEIADLSDLENSTSLEFLDLNRNLLTTPGLILPFLPALDQLFLDENRLESITESLFSGLPRLKSLSLEGNYIQTIDANAFQSLAELTELNLAHNQLVTIPPHVFRPVGNLTKLLIGYNPFENLPISLFSPLGNLQSLDLQEIDMDNVGENMFDLFPKLDFVYFKKFHYCTTYAPKVQKCRPASDGVSSLSHLLGKPLLRAAVWGISSVTFLGNALVLWGRFTSKDENRVLSIVIRNLAGEFSFPTLSDMLMGIYLFVIAVEDIRFRDNYNQVASTWMSSWSCTVVGILAMTSSEVSVLILSFMSVERFMLIAAPLKGHRALTPHAASSSMIVIWIIGIILALTPAIHWRSSTRFYGVNGMCFPLHIDDPYLVGWQYSAFIFLGLNLLGLIIIGYVYAGMFASIWRTRHATPLSVGDSEFALRFFLIVMTDAACWAPIITLKILALLNYPVAPDLHAWVVVFILPVNSAVNPLLYTFTTPKFRERLSEGWFGKMRSYVARKHSAQETPISSSLSNRNIVLSLSGGSKCPADKKITRVKSLNNDGLVNGLHDHIL